MTARLVVFEGKARGSELALGVKPIYELGSARTADACLDDPEVAPVHAKLYLSAGEYSVFDVSGRGFLHNGKRTLKTSLAEGDVLQLGEHRLRFTRSEALAGAAPLAVPAPAAITRAELHAVKGNDAGKTYDLRTKDIFVIGRGVATDITVWDIRVSRVHCRIDRDGEGYLLTDLNASNSTYVNGQKIETHRLRSGDEIKLGSTVLQYLQS